MPAEGRILDTRFLRTLGTEPPPSPTVKFGRRGADGVPKDANTRVYNEQADAHDGEFEPSPEFLRNGPVLHESGAGNESDRPDGDLLHLAIQNRRAELDTLETEISSVNSTLEIEENRLREVTKAIEYGTHQRERLERLRTALTRFLTDIEAPLTP